LSDPVASAKATPAVAFCFLLNALLERERWARERLVSFAGQAVELRLPLWPSLRICIGPQGNLEPGGPEPSAAITLHGIEGASALADELRYLARHLRPDFEEELSHLFGDVAAERIGGAVRGLASWQRDAALRITDALADYAIDERRALVRRVELRELAADIERLSAALAGLEQRISRLD
jgi:ubiquinone biosynthesis protein UbiJ